MIVIQNKILYIRIHLRSLFKIFTYPNDILRKIIQNFLHIRIVSSENYLKFLTHPNDNPSGDYLKSLIILYHNYIKQ